MTIASIGIILASLVATIVLVAAILFAVYFITAGKTAVGAPNHPKGK